MGKIKYDSKDKHGDCIFCKIVSGEIKTPGIFWEDDEHMAFLSIFPNTEGFSVVIPKKHYGSDVLELKDDVLHKLILASKQVSKILKRHFDDVGRVGLMMEGTGVDHAHIKLFPMHGTKDFANGEWRQFLSKEETFFEKYEGYISSSEGPRMNDEQIKVLAKKLKS